MAGFPLVSFHAAPGASGVVVVVGSHVDDRRSLRAVVAAKEHEGVVGNSESLECLHQLSDNPIELMNKVPVWASLGFALELFGWKRGQVDGLGGVVQEERFLGV